MNGFSYGMRVVTEMAKQSSRVVVPIAGQLALAVVITGVQMYLNRKQKSILFNLWARK